MRHPLAKTESALRQGKLPGSEAQVAIRSDRDELWRRSRRTPRLIEPNGRCARCADTALMSSTCARASSALRGLPLVAVMTAADFRNRDDRCGGRCRDGSGIWRVLLEPEMCATPMIVAAVDREDASQMCLVEHDHVIQAFATD
jgi:hypothetical protein